MGILEVNAQADYTNFGKVYRLSSTYSMFPDSVRNKEPRIYQGKTYNASEHYQDSSALVFVPSYFSTKKPFELVIYIHGWNNCIDSSLKQFDLIKQLYSTNKNAILIFPEGPKNAPDSYAGKFEKATIFNSFIKDILDKLNTKKVITNTQNFKLVIAGHSGAYRAMSYILLHSTYTIEGIALLDALYGSEEKFAVYLQKNKNCKLINIYTNEGGTMQNSIDFMTSMTAWKWKFLQREEETLTKHDLINNRIIFIHSNRGHNDVVDKLGMFLKYW